MDKVAGEQRDDGSKNGMDERYPQNGLEGKKSRRDVYAIR